MQTPTSIARAVAGWIIETRAADLDAQVLDKAKTCLRDMIGVAAQAADLPASRQAAQFAAAMGGTRATLIGSTQRASVADAAFANATCAHGLVQEDMHTASVSHIGVVVWPTLLALSEYEPAAGRKLLSSAVAGYQVMARLGAALITKDLARMFRPTGLIGAVGGAAAGACLLGLSEGETVSALGLAANTAGGLNEWPHCGGDDMFFHAGNAARNAVTSVLLAGAGARASESALDGRAGLFAAYRGAVPASLDLAGAWEILAVYHKPAPACNYAQTPAQAAISLARKTSFSPKDIEGVLVKSFPEAIAYPGCDHPGPYRTLLQAKMSIQFVVAATLAAGRLDDAALRDFSAGGEAAQLARRVRLENDPQFAAAYPGRQGAEVVVTMKNGASHRARLPELEPLDAQGVHARFLGSVTRLLGEARAQQLTKEIANLETCEDAGRLARLLGRA
jgi:2-methylcitrate dehydratase PrpD